MTIPTRSRCAAAAQICLAAVVLAVIALHLCTRPDALLLRLRPGPEIFVGKNFARLRELDPRLTARPLAAFAIPGAAQDLPVPPGVDAGDVWGVRSSAARDWAPPRLQSDPFVLEARYLEVPVLGQLGGGNRIALMTDAKPPAEIASLASQDEE